MTVNIDDGRRYWAEAMESRLGTEWMRDLQVKRLQEVADDLLVQAPYFGDKLRAAGVLAGSDIRSVSDWSAALPPFSKADYRDLLTAHDNDVTALVDDVLRNPPEEVVTFAATSGTTGEPQPYPLTRTDLEQGLGEFYLRVKWRAGMRPGDRVLHGMALSMFVTGVPAFQQSRDFTTMIPAGAEGGTARLLNMARFFKANALMATPSLAEYLIERAPSELGAGVDSLGIKVVLCGGEPGAGLPATKARIEDAFGARLFDYGAAMGVSCDWPDYQGMHVVAEDIQLYELVDPVSREPVELRDGAVGEAVMTCLVGSGMGMMRQTLGDIHEVMVSPCPCGATGIRYRVVGRVDHMLKVKGVMVYPVAIDGVLGEFVPRITGEFRIALSEPPPRVVPPLRLRIEYGEATSQADLTELAEEIASRMHQRLKVRPAIEWLPPYSLDRSSHKSRFIEVDA